MDQRRWRFGVWRALGGWRGEVGGKLERREGVDVGVDVRGGEKGWLREARVVGGNGVGLGRRERRRERDERRNRRGGSPCG